MSAGNHAVFLSYASQDAGAAHRIADALRAAGVEVWLDKNALAGGDAWDAKIRTQIKDCALLIPIISANTQSRTEGYFRLEWRLADQRTHLMAKGRPFLLPVVIDDTNDAEAHVPDSFTEVQWTRLPAGETPPAFAQRVGNLVSGDLTPRSTVSASLARFQGLGRETEKAPLLGAAAPYNKSVAVLAFANLSDDESNEYFSDGISEELLNVLAKVPGLKVSARTSAFYFKGKQVPIPEIAQKLGVAYVVEGSVRKSGSRVRITAQLIKAADGFHMWSENFDRELKDIFAVQDEIAGLIAQNLKLKLEVTSAVRSVNPAAYDLWLQGRTIFTRGNPHDYPKGIQHYKEALTLDEDFALTWAALAIGYAVSAAQGELAVESGFAQARAAANRALALDADSAQAHYALGLVHFLADWDWAQADASYQRALALAPSDVTILSSAATLAQTLGQPERALRLSRTAEELDPLNFLPAYALAKSYLQLSCYDEMEKHGERMIAMNSDGRYGYVFLTFARLLQSRIEAAAEVVERMKPNLFQLTCLALVRHAQGRTVESDAALNELKVKFSKNSGYQIAEIYAYRQEPDRAFEWLEAAYRERDPGLTWITYDPFMKNVRTDARWPVLLKKMNLPDLPPK